MANKDNQSQRFIYIRSLKEKVPCTEQQFQEFYREATRIRKKEQYYHRCKCPKQFIWACDGDCENCEHHLGYRWFANKSCPGNWLYARLGDLATKVTAQLGVTTTAPEPTTSTLYRVRKTWTDTDAIAKELDDEGVPTKRGGKWTSTSVRGILANEKYTGDVIFQKTYTDDSFNRHTNKGELDMYYVADHHEAIISKEDFEAAGLLISQRAAEKGIKRESQIYQQRYAFSGKIICNECGDTCRILSKTNLPTLQYLMKHL